MTTVDSQKFEGLGSGIISLLAVNDSSIDSTTQTFSITSGAAAFIEFDYNTTVPTYVAMQSTLGAAASLSPYYIAGMKPNGKWQKFYAYATDFVNGNQGTAYNFYVKAILDKGQTSGRLLIDNIQLVTFK